MFSSSVFAVEFVITSLERKTGDVDYSQLFEISCMYFHIDLAQKSQK